MAGKALAFLFLFSVLAEWAKIMRISSLESAFELVFSDIFEVDDAEEATDKFHSIRKIAHPSRQILWRNPAEGCLYRTRPLIRAGSRREARFSKCQQS